VLTEREVTSSISQLKSYWVQRNSKFKDWYEILTLVDVLKTTGMESYVSNEPMSFWNMAHYLLTKGDISHTTPIETESALELDRRARIHRACEYMWKKIDRERMLGGNQTFIDELSFYLLVLGWYAVVEQFDKDTGELRANLWNPSDTFPNYSNNKLLSCVHSYSISGEEAKEKASDNGWNYTSRANPLSVTLDDYFTYEDGMLYNMILIDNHAVTEWVDRPDMHIMVSPVGGFPDKGSLIRSGNDWRKLTGRGIFEVNDPVTKAFNKWKTIISQVLRDSSNPITEEFSASPQAVPEQLRERGALFHYAPGEQGLIRVAPPVIPMELQSQLLELRREMQKGSFNDAVFGMMEGQPGYALSLLASSSANQILYPYMDAKHFVIGECDKFWLSNLKSSNRTFNIKGRFIEKLKPVDIPDDIMIEVESQVATPKDWMERGTIANMLKDQLDDSTIITQIFGMNDPQSIKRRRSLDRILEHPMSQMVEMITGYYAHADYLDKLGDSRQAGLFRRAAQSLESQLGVPPAGSGLPAQSSQVSSQVNAGAPAERTRIPANISPPEANSAMTPMQMRQLLGRGNMKVTQGGQ
jgi:hypothetical protein